MENSRAMMKRLILLAALLTPFAAHADPVITAIVAWYVAASAVTVALVVGSVVLSAGMAIYGAAQARRAERDAKNAANAAMQDRMATKIAAESPHVYIYGRAKVGASIVAMFTSGDKDQYKHIVGVLAAHECDAVEEVYINNVAVGLLNSSGDATTGRYAPIPGTEVFQEPMTGPTFTLSKYPVGVVQVFTLQGMHMVEVTVTSQSGRNITVAYSGSVIVNYQYNVVRRLGDAVDETVPVVSIPYVRVQIHLGTPTDPADAYLMSVVPDKWTSTAVLRGLTYLVVTLDLNNPEFQGGQVPIQALVRGRKLYDPRTGLTAWSQNPAIGTMDYLTSPLCGVSLSDLPVAQYITAANVCDETTGGWFDSTHYTMNGTATSDQNQATVLESMAQCMAGGIVSTTWDIYAGKYIAPVIALDQSDIVGALSITPGASDAAIYNGVKGQFISDENDYVMTDFAPFQNPTYLAADGRDLYTDIPFPFTDSLQRVHNLARIFTEDMRNGFTMKAEFSLKAWPIKVGQRVTFTSTFLGQSSKVYRVTDKSYAPNSAVELTLKEDDASIWDFADAVTVDSTPNTNLPDPWAIAPLASLSCTSGASTLLTQADGSIVPRILVTWPVATTAAVFTNGQIEIEWRAISTDTWQKAVVSGSATETYLSPITPGFFYAVRARTVNPYLNVKSNWVMVTYQVAVSRVTPTVYMWASDMPPAPSGAASYTWATGAFGAAPSGWSLTEPAPPAGGDSTLWSAGVPVSDISITGSTPFNWGDAGITAIGYAPPPAGTGPAGPSGTQVATVSLYQFSTSTPAAPTGTSTLTWATGANSAYSAADNWFVAAPSNPGTPGIKLFVATVSVSAAATVTASTVSYSSAAVSAWSQNGATGATGSTGIQSAIATVYQWAATIPAGPSGSPTLTWATGLFGAAPSGYSLTPGTAPSPGYTLWAATVRVTDSAANATTGFNWSTAAVIAIGYAGSNGGPGAEGASYVTAYCATSIGAGTSAPAATTGRTSLPATGSGGLTGAVYSASVPTLDSTHPYQMQTDGIYNPATNQITWSIPYQSSLKVATLSAITANLGAITAGSMDIGTGTTSWHVDSTGNTWAGASTYAAAPYRVSNAGVALFKSATFQTSGGATVLDATGLQAGYEAPGTKNSDFSDGTLTIGGDNLAPNSSFEKMASGLANGWNLYNNNSSGEPATAFQSTGRVSGISQGISWTGNHFSEKGIWGVATQAGWLPNSTYLLSFYAKSTSISGSQSFFLAWDVSPTSVVAIANPAITSSFQRYVFKIVWGSSVEASGYGYISVTNGGGPGNVSFDDLMVVEGSVLPSYYPSAGDAQSAADAANTAINDATTGLATRLRNNAANILSGGAGIAVGSLTWNSSGVRTGGYGVGLTSFGLVGYNSSGALTLSINASTGAVAVAGDISGSTGTFGDVIVGTSLRCGQTAYNTGTGIWQGFVGGVPKQSIGVAGGAGVTFDGTTLTIKDAVNVKTTQFAINHTTGNSYSYAKSTNYQFLGSYTAGSTGGTGTVTYAFSLDQGFSPGAGMASYITISGATVSVYGKCNLVTNCDIYINVTATDASGAAATPWSFNINVDWT